MAKTEDQVVHQGQVSVSTVTVDDNNNNNNNNNSNTNNDNNINHDNDVNDSKDNKHELRNINPLKPSSGKYQLRPRSLQARRFCDSDWSFQDTIRDKPRPQPLSRYRRKTANARERYRMRQINTAFESLRGVLPSWVCSRRAASDLTKITTLRLASAYIRALQDILDGNTSEDSCPWVFSSILNDSSSPKETQPDTITTTTDSGKSEGAPFSQTAAEADFVSLLCSSADPVTLDDSFDSFSHLSPMSDSDPVTLLFLGSDASSRCWGEGQHVSLVT